VVKSKYLFSIYSDREIENFFGESSQFKTVNHDKYEDFWRVWQSEQDYFYKLCLKWMGNNSHDAEDVMHSSMIHAWNKWQKSANEISNVKGWLRRIIYNFCMDILRKRQREAETIDNIDELQLSDSAVFICRSYISNSATNILERETHIYIEHLIQSLPKKLSQPFILFCRHDNSYREVAKKLAMSDSNARKLIQSAKKILKDELEKYWAGECINFTSTDPFNILKKDIDLEENFESSQTVMSQRESSITITSKSEKISYEITAICLEKPLHHWCILPYFLG
jgi:RNA polymerase sigma-70 factor (ECF subfamily)